MNIRRTLVCVALATIFSIPWGATARAEKIGIVDIQRILDSVDQGKRAKNEFEQAMKSKAEELEKRKQDLAKMDEQFEKQKLILAPAAVDEKRKELEAKKMEFQQFYMTSQAEMAKKEKSLAEDIVLKIRKIAEEIGRTKGYSFIFEKNEGGLVFYQDGFDLTAEVIKKFNQRHK